METTFIYGLLDPNDQIIKYVGKADNPALRLKLHLNECKKSKSLKNNWLKSLIKNNQIPLMVILEECNFAVWQQKESEWIEFYRNLYPKENKNGTNGGEGGNTTIFMSDEDLKIRNEKVRLAKIGKKRDPELMERIRQTKIEKHVHYNRKNRTCKYFGVNKHRNKFRVRLFINKKEVYIGVYETELEAALAYDDYILANDYNNLYKFPLNFERNTPCHI